MGAGLTVSKLRMLPSCLRVFAPSRETKKRLCTQKRKAPKVPSQARPPALEKGDSYGYCPLSYEGKMLPPNATEYLFPLRPSLAVARLWRRH